MQNETQVIYYYISIRMAKNKSLTILNVNDEMKQNSHSADESVNYTTLYQNNI